MEGGVDVASVWLEGIILCATFPVTRQGVSLADLVKRRARCWRNGQVGQGSLLNFGGLGRAGSEAWSSRSLLTSGAH